MAFTAWKHEEKSRHKFQKGSFKICTKKVFKSVLSTIISQIRA